MQKHVNKGKYRDKFKMLKHLAQEKTREAYWNYISDIIAPVDSTNERPNAKKFFTCLKSIRKESNGVPTLKAFGETVNEIQDKTNLLNRQFQSVFTTDTDKEMPDIPKEVFKEMPEITITENGVEKLLQNLNPNKACGPDELTPR